MSLKAREAAFLALRAYRKRGARPDIVLNNFLDEIEDRRDMALASNILDGVLQNSVLCDYYIGCFSTTSVKKLEKDVIDILRISVYQIIFLDKIPIHATVSEGVELAKKYVRRASGLVNAVLRRVAENRESLPEIKADSEAERLSMLYSHPVWMVEEFTKSFGVEECEKILKSDNTPAPVTIQTNTLKISTDDLISELRNDGVIAARSKLLDDAVFISGTGAIDKLEAFEKGKFYVQDIAARLAVEAAAPQPGMKVMDVCAAPGGKSFASAIMMKNTGNVYSFDIHEKKLGQIRTGAERLGISIIEVCQGDAKTKNEKFVDFADVVIADVPCSGLGVLRKKPDIRRKTREDLEGLPNLQLEILKNVSQYVKHGGVLVYSTCTILSSENEGVVREFLKDNDSFELEPFTLFEPFGKTNGMKTILPHIADTDGFFICKMRRRF